VKLFCGILRIIGQYRIILSADTASEVRQLPERCVSRKAGIMRCCHRYIPEMTSLFPIARALHMSLDDLCFWGSAADGRDTIHDLQSIVSTCSPYEAEMLLVVSRAVLSVMRGGSTKDAVNPNKEPALAK